MFQILHLGNDVFDSAFVDAIIALFKSKTCRELCILQANSRKEFEIVNKINKSIIKDPYLIDQYFQKEQPQIIAQLEYHKHRLGEYAKCEYASASPSDAYKLKKYIKSNHNLDIKELAILNTGLINKFTNRYVKPERIQGVYTK